MYDLTYVSLFVNFFDNKQLYAIGWNWYHYEIPRFISYETLATEIKCVYNLMYMHGIIGYIKDFIPVNYRDQI